MKFEIHVYTHTDAAAFHLADEMKAALFRLETRMAQLDDKLNSILGKLDKLDAAVKAETQQVLEKVNTFSSTIADLTSQRDALQTQIDTEGITPERQAKLDQIDARLDQLPTDVDAVDPTSTTTVPEA